jgi:hypothetical protein
MGGSSSQNESDVRLSIGREYRVLEESLEPREAFSV